MLPGQELLLLGPSCRLINNWLNDGEEENSPKSKQPIWRRRLLRFCRDESTTNKQSCSLYICVFVCIHRRRLWMNETPHKIVDWLADYNWLGLKEEKQSTGRRRQPRRAIQEQEAFFTSPPIPPHPTHHVNSSLNFIEVRATQNLPQTRSLHTWNNPAPTQKQISSRSGIRLCECISKKLKFNSLLVAVLLFYLLLFPSRPLLGIHTTSISVYLVQVVGR